MFEMVIPAMAAENSPTKILFVGKNPDHPYGSHMYLHVCGVLAKCAEQSAAVFAYWRSNSIRHDQTMAEW